MGRTITTWGRQCKAQMILLDISLAELSRRVGLSPTYVSTIINGRYLPSDDVIAKINAVLQIPDPQPVS